MMGEILDEDKKYDYFDKWFKNEQDVFHCGQYDDKQIAFSAFLQGIGFSEKIGKLSEG
jgi:hypothetical protein